MGIAVPVMGEVPTAALLPPSPTASPTYNSLSAPLAITSTDTATFATIAISAPVPRKRFNDNSAVSVRRKKNRMTSVNTDALVKIDSSFNRSVVWYYRKNASNCSSYDVFLRSS
ncbi:uncharacterized protein LOC112693692 isoform X2 [Sipha flava]|nr:uncharacterized protein LOC112693692 isoform X2 [Sipha flava]